MSSPHEIEALRALIPSDPNAVGFDIGCGNKPISPAVGVDLYANAVVRANAADLPFRTGSCDYIVSCHCLEHVNAGPLLVLREWLRCLKTHGVLALAVPNGLPDPESALRYQVPPGKYTVGQHLHIFTPDSLQAYMTCAGAENVHTTVIERPGYWKSSVILTHGTKSPNFQLEPYRFRRLHWIKQVIKDQDRFFRT